MPHDSSTAKPAAFERGALGNAFAPMLTAAATAAVFTSAGLLFVVQPMVSKLLLPLFGGTSAVWTTCMLWFQLVLLAGYLYAHYGSELLGARRHAMLHLLLLLGAFLALPPGLPVALQPRSGDPVLRLIGLLFVLVGLPFFALSSTGPLVQRWFAATPHPDASNPYFLYAASNIGSLLALLAYPILVEPRIGLAGQAIAWSRGFGLLVLLMAGVVSVSWGAWRAPALAGNAPRSAAIRWLRRVRWIALAAVPSSLMLGVTSFTTTDIAAVPFFWVVPLAAYLLTFAAVFARKPPISHAFMIRVQPLVAVTMVVLWYWAPPSAGLGLLPLHLLAFFVAAMVCHGELAADRPRTDRLTEFYCWVAVGGALGGVFNVMIAPVVFDAVLEYPIAIAAALMLRPALSAPGIRPGHALAGAVVLGGGLWLVTMWLSSAAAGRGAADPLLIGVLGLVAGTTGAALYAMRRAPVAFGLAVLVVLGVRHAVAATGRALLLTERSFYGVHVVEHDARRGINVLLHGSTQHGAQYVSPGRRGEPLAYYSRSGPLGDLFGHLRRERGRLRVAVVGLGAGAVAAYAAAGDQWTFYEIDPIVVGIARNPRYFSYLSAAPVPMPVELGDARLRLVDAPNADLDLLVVDAFSSDAIPVHLLTREAITLYGAKLRPGGLVVFNLSNRYLELVPVVAGGAAGVGYSSAIRAHDVPPEGLAAGIAPSIWLATSPEESMLPPSWSRTEGDPARGWRDDYSDVLSALF